jgi:lipopolysaccharide biosynthesis protein
MPESELAKIRPYTKYACSAPHAGYDFGSWQCLICYIGWQKICEYDEMIICNDSIYGPMTNLEDIFDYMELRDYDFWGLTENYNSRYHLDSYFMVFTDKVLKNKKFQEFWNNITPERSRKTYESVLTPFLVEQGFVGNSFIKNYKKEEQTAYPLRLLKQNRMPFIRVKALRDPTYHLKESSFRIDKKIGKKSRYDSRLILDHLTNLGQNQRGFGLFPTSERLFRKIKTKLSELMRDR